MANRNQIYRKERSALSERFGITWVALILAILTDQKGFLSPLKPGRQKDIAKATISGWIKGIIRSAYSEAKSEDIPHLTSQNVGGMRLSVTLADIFHPPPLCL